MTGFVLSSTAPNDPPPNQFAGPGAAPPGANSCKSLPGGGGGGHPCGFSPLAVSVGTSPSTPDKIRGRPECGSAGPAGGGGGKANGPCLAGSGPLLPGQSRCAPSNGNSPFSKTDAILSKCEAQASAAAQPYWNDVTMPSANEATGAVVLGILAKLFTGSNPVAILISAGSTVRKQIGGAINGTLVQNGVFQQCSIDNGINPVAFNPAF